jgi:hypothetical protein
VPRIILQNRDPKDRTIYIYINGTKSYSQKYKYDYVNVNNKIGDQICIKYVTDYANSLEDRIGSNLIFQDTFLLTGFYSFPLPEIDGVENFNATFYFKGNSNKIISNIGKVTNGSIKKHIKKQTLDNSFFASGFLKRRLESNLQHYILYTPSFEKIAQGTIETIRKLKKEQTKLIDNKDLEQEFFILTPSVNDTWGRAESGKNYFYQIVAIPKNEKFDNQSTLDEISEIIAHEHVHKLFDRKFDLPTNPKKSYWFFEGFVDYLGMLSNYTSGVWSLETYLFNYNNKIKYYFEYGLDSLPLEECYLLPIFGQVGYMRGHAFAHKIDNALKYKFYNSNGFIEFFNKLKNSINENKESIYENNVFCNALLKYSKISFHKLLTKIKKGINLKSLDLFDTKILDNNACLEWKKIRIPLYEVDLFKTIWSQKLEFKNNLLNKNISGKIYDEMKSDKNNRHIFYLKFNGDNNWFKIEPKSYVTKNVPQYNKCK